MKMEDDGSCAHEMDPRTRGAPRPGLRQTATDRDGGRGTEPAADAHETSGHVFGRALRRGSGKGAERECDISLNRTEKVESNSANRCELIVGDI